MLLLCRLHPRVGLLRLLRDASAAGDRRASARSSLRVVKEGGYPIGFIDSVLRNLLRGADFLPFGYVARPGRDGRATRASGASAICVAGTHGGRRGAQPRRRAADDLAAAHAGGAGRSARSARRCRRWERETLELYLRRVGRLSARARGRAGADDRARARASGMGITVERSASRFLALLHQLALARRARRPRAASAADDAAGRIRRRAPARLGRARAAARRGRAACAGCRPRRSRAPPRSIAPSASDLMRAEAAGYSPDVIALLDGLAARAHNALYSAPPYRLRAVWELVAADFPRTLRRHGRFFALAVRAVRAAGRASASSARCARARSRCSVLPPTAVEQMEKAYAEGFDKGREAGANTRDGRLLRLQQRRHRLPLLRDRRPVRPRQPVLPRLQRPRRSAPSAAGRPPPGTASNL